MQSVELTSSSDQYFDSSLSESGEESCHSSTSASSLLLDLPSKLQQNDLNSDYANFLRDEVEFFRNKKAQLISKSTDSQWRADLKERLKREIEDHVRDALTNSTVQDKAERRVSIAGPETGAVEKAEKINHIRRHTLQNDDSFEAEARLFNRRLSRSFKNTINVNYVEEAVLKAAREALQLDGQPQLLDEDILEESTLLRDGFVNGSQVETKKTESLADKIDIFGISNILQETRPRKLLTRDWIRNIYETGNSNFLYSVHEEQVASDSKQRLRMIQQVEKKSVNIASKPAPKRFSLSEESTRRDSGNALSIKSSHRPSLDMVVNNRSYDIFGVLPKEFTHWPPKKPPCDWYYKRAVDSVLEQNIPEDTEDSDDAPTDSDSDELPEKVDKSGKASSSDYLLNLQIKLYR
ncbi:hypothetical protein Ciccas_002542 [Cichlidogyrus casuarinus]|uniref:Uncharacterized protein n=1 Tax=Cichlidogyrus casuarinus TaxID=1844966 RepID=A0ABD2QGX8_9PLAT